MRAPGKSRSAGGVALTYAKGKVCPKCQVGGVADQRSYCGPCQSEYSRAYYWKNRDRQLAYMKRYSRVVRSRRLSVEQPSGYDDITDPPIPEYTYAQLGLGLIDCDVVRHGHSPETVIQDLGDIRAAIAERVGARYIDFDTLHFDNYPSQDDYQWYHEDEPRMPVVSKRPSRAQSHGQKPHPPRKPHPARKQKYDTWWNYWEDVID